MVPQEMKWIELPRQLIIYSFILISLQKDERIDE